MAFRSRTLFLVVSTLCILALIFQWIKAEWPTQGTADPRPPLSGKIEVIDLRHVRRSCACPEWIDATRFKDSAQTPGDAYIYLEAARSAPEIPSSYWALQDSGYLVRLRGEFYQGKTIPRDYAAKTAQSPLPALVFQYTSSQLIKPQE
jgi:hypothetical protein